MGDACHPMTPYMAQGAANALETPSSSLAALSKAGLRMFRLRSGVLRQRGSHVKVRNSHRNEFMRERTDPDWVYAYDAWNVELPDQLTDGGPTVPFIQNFCPLLVASCGKLNV